MKYFDSFAIDFDRCREELAGLKNLLDEFEAGALKEREHVLSFFRENRHVAALVGHNAPDIANVDRIAHEFDFFGDYAADLALGDSRKHEYCFVEFENAAPGSIFRKVAGKSSLEWSSRFEHGYSQIIDWFWKLHDMARSDTGRARFDYANTFNYYGLLVIGRSKGLAPIEKERLNWRRKKVLVDSKHVFCMTFDELYDDLIFRLDQYAPPVGAAERARGASLKPLKRPIRVRIERWKSRRSGFGKP